MPGAAAEKAFFARLRPHVGVQSYWPAGQLESEEAVERFSRLMFDAGRDDEGRTRGTPDQIQHFACHFYSGNDPAARWRIQLATEDGAETNITMSELVVALNDRLSEASPEEERPPQPLVFMNACGASAIDPGSTISLPHLFLDQGHVGFIGPETRVPDPVAAAFSARFYRQLAGETVAEALHSAKWLLLSEYGNPLGILYTMYGDPDLLVEQIVPEGALDV